MYVFSISFLFELWTLATQHRLIQDLVSSRANIKFTLGDASRTKWSTMRPHAQAIMNSCLACWDEKDDILNNPERWTDAELPDNASDVIKTAKATAVSVSSPPSAADVWAASMNCQVFKQLDLFKQLCMAENIQVSIMGFAIVSAEAELADGDRDL